MLSSLCFVTFVLLTIMKLRINNKPTRLLSRYYFEIYTIQGIPLTFFKTVWKIENPAVYIICVVLTTALLAVIIHPVYQLISKVAKDGFKNKKCSKQGGQYQ